MMGRDNPWPPYRRGVSEWRHVGVVADFKYWQWMLSPYEVTFPISYHLQVGRSESFALRATKNTGADGPEIGVRDRPTQPSMS